MQQNEPELPKEKHLLSLLQQEANILEAIYSQRLQADICERQIRGAMVALGEIRDKIGQLDTQIESSNQVASHPEQEKSDSAAKD